MNVSELKKEIESDKAFIEKVADRIYKDNDEREETIPEPEWIDRMTEIADRYLNRFELAQKLADKWIQSKSPQLNENQQIVLEWLKGRFKGGSSLFNAIQGFRGFNGVPAIELNALMSLSNNEESQVLQAFATWVLKQEWE